MDQPLVTVIVPCFNAARWLPETLDCLRGQSYSNLDIIAVDDGSTDETWQILEQCKDPRLRVFKQANLGAASARNAALEFARGDYLQFLDADDVIARDKVELQLRAAYQFGPQWVIASRWGRFDTNLAETRWEPLWVPLKQSGLEWTVNSWEHGDMMPPHGWLVPRKIVQDAGPWVNCLNDDGEYFTRILLRAAGAIQVPDARVHYRSGNASFSQRTDSWAWQSLLDSYELCANHMLHAEHSDRVKKAIASRLRGFQYLAYPAFPELADRVESIVKALDLPPGIPHGGGAISQIASRLVGWKLTRKLGSLVKQKQNEL